jgi:hypothetical protein
MTTTDRPAINPRRILASATLALAAAVGFGCTSQDRHTFESPTFRPTTITVLDATNREPIWSYDIPPGHILKIDTDADMQPQSNYTGGNRATQMTWEVFDESAREGPFDSHLAQPIDKGKLEFDTPTHLLMSYDIRRPQPTPTAETFQRTDLPTGRPVVTERTTPTAPATPEAGALEASDLEAAADRAEPAAAVDAEPEIARPATIRPAERQSPAGEATGPVTPAEPTEPAEPADAVADEIDLLEGVMDK